MLCSMLVIALLSSASQCGILRCVLGCGLTISSATLACVGWSVVASAFLQPLVLAECFAPHRIAIARFGKLKT